jgi:membrane fusion protein, multidrug efflux system
MKVTRSYFIIYFIALLSVAGFISCSDSEGTPVKEERKESSVYVQTTRVSTQSYSDFIYVIATAKAAQRAELSPEEGGRIQSFNKDKGDYVKEGEVIATINNDILKANMDALRAQYDMAQTNFERQEKIFKENVTSEMQFLNSKYERDAAKANFELIKSRYEKSFIKAPFAGVIDAKYYEVGETVAPGNPIVTLLNTDRIKVSGGVSENHTGSIKKGDKVRVRFPDLGGGEFNERITYVGNSISTENRTFPIEVEIRNSDRRIKPELSAEVYIETKSFDSVVLVPEEVVVKTDLGYVVFVEEGGIARMRKIEIINRSNNKVAIKEGLREGDNLVIVGYQNLIDGERVTVVR